MQTYTSIAAAILMLSALPQFALAGEHDRARALSNAGTIVPLERITAQMRARSIDHILEVELESDAAGHYYEVEGLDDQGRVRKLKYDATTGELISEERDD